MATHQHATLEDTVYFWFGSNQTDGDGNDGASPVFDVRLAGDTAGAAPILSGSATLLSHANYTAGAHEVAIAATDGNGFVAGNTYAVFVSLLVDSVNPTGFAGSVTLGPIISNITEIGGDDQSATDLKDFADAGYDPGTNKVQGVVLVDTTTTNTDKNTLAATDIVTGGAIATTGGAVDNVTLVDTTTTNTDKNTLAATDIVTGGAIATTGGAVDNVTLVDTTTTNTDKNTLAATDIVSSGAITTNSGAVVSVTTTATATALTTNNDKTDYTLSTSGVDAVLDDEVDNDGSAISLRQAQKLILSILTAKSSGGGTATLVFRDINDSKNRLSVTVDANGNRTAVGTRDAT